MTDTIDQMTDDQIAETPQAELGLPEPEQVAEPGARFRLCTVADIMGAVEAATDALDGDGSTQFMTDVRPDQAARYVLAGLDAAGFVLVRRAS